MKNIEELVNEALGTKDSKTRRELMRFKGFVENQRDNMAESVNRNEKDSKICDKIQSLTKSEKMYGHKLEVEYGDLLLKYANAKTELERLFIEESNDFIKKIEREIENV